MEVIAKITAEWRDNMATRPTEERLADIDKKMEQLKAQKRALQARQSAEERKKRTKRLIEVGATVEKVLGRPIEQEELPKLLNFLKQQEERGQYFSKAMNSGSDEH